MATYRKFRDPDYGKPIIAPTHGDTVAPQNDLAAAAWLPISASQVNSDAGYFTYDYQRHVFTDKVVIMPGKLVALTAEALKGENSLASLNQGTVGRLVPAGIRLAWKAAGNTDEVLEYTAEDVAERIEDLGTGLPVAAPKTYLKNSDNDGADLNLTKRLRSRGLIRSSDTIDALISRPIGVAANVVYAWAGGDGTQPNKLRFMNYRRENKSTFWTGQDHTLRLPVAPATNGSEAIPVIGTKVSTLAEFEGGVAQWVLGSEMASILKHATILKTRYSALTNANWVALQVGKRAIEHNIYNLLTIKDSGGVDKTSTVLKVEKTSPESVTKLGDYFVDRDMGLVFMYEGGGNGIPVGIAADGTDVIYFAYSPVPVTDTADAPVKVFASVTGSVKPGDYLAYDKYSNFVPYIARPDETLVTATDGESSADANDDATVEATAYVSPTLYHRPEDIVGKCYTLDRSPKADLAAVKTFHDYEGVLLADRTPGSANDGHPAEIHQSFGGQFAAIVRVLL